MKIKVTEKVPGGHPLTWEDLVPGHAYIDDQGDSLLVVSGANSKKAGIFYKTGDLVLFDYANNPRIKFRGPIDAEVIFHRDRPRGT